MLRKRFSLARSAVSAAWRSLTSARSAAVRSRTALSIRRVRPVVIRSEAPSIDAESKPTIAIAQALRPPPSGTSATSARTRTSQLRPANTIGRSCPSAAFSASQPICPARWRLPARGSASATQSFRYAGHLADHARELRLHRQGHEHHAAQSGPALGSAGALDVVDRLVDDDADVLVVAVLLGQAEPGGGRRLAAVDGLQDRGARGRNREAVDAERGRVALHRLDQADGDGFAGVGARQEAGRGVGGEARFRRGRRCGSQGSHRRARAPRRRRNPRAARARSSRSRRRRRSRASAGSPAACRRGRLAGDIEDAAHRLQRAQRLLELGGEDQGGARRVVRERRAQALLVPARGLDDRQPEEGGDQGHGQAHRQPARCPFRARPADQRQDDRRGDEQPGEVAHPPGGPGGDELRGRDHSRRAPGHRSRAMRRPRCSPRSTPGRRRRRAAASA